MNTEADIDEFDDAQDVTGLKHKVQQLLRQNRRLKDRVKELEAPKSPTEPTPPREKFLQDAGRRLVGLEGEARTAELAKIEQELQPLVDAELEEIRRTGRGQVEALQGTIRRLVRESAAIDLVARIKRPGIATELLMPTILPRLDVEERDGEFTAVGKGPNGPLTLEALAEELRATPALAPLIAGASADEKAAHARKVQETLLGGPTR
jgi:hypothetical protein